MLYKMIIFTVTLSLIAGCSFPEPEDITPPVTVVVFPYEGAVISDNVNVQIGAADNDKVSKVWYFLNGIKRGEVGAPPYEIPLDISGLERKVNHVIMAAAIDESGNTGYSTNVNFTVAETPDIIPPIVAIVNPQTGQVVEQTVKILAHAEDERSIQKVAFFLNGDSIETVHAYPYEYLWDTSGYSDSTQHTIFAKAWDTGNNLAVSTVVSVTVYPRSGEAGDSEAPSALILFPIAGSAITGTVQVSADLADNVGVARVEFYVDGVLETSRNNPPTPWTYNWDTSAKADGNDHTLFLKVYDAAGNVGTSALMTVTIN